MSRKGYGPWPKEKIQEAKTLLESGATLQSVADKYEVGTHTLRCKIDPLYAIRRTMRHNEQRYANGYYEPNALGRNYTDRGRPPPEDVAARLAEIPRDTRDLTAFICGDPLPGRRAIDRRQHSDRET